MNKLENFWEHVCYTFIAGIVGVSVFICGYAIFQNHKVTHYYISSEQHDGNSDHELTIIGNIEWALDEQLILDRDVSYEDAIKLCDKMNKRLRK